MEVLHYAIIISVIIGIVVFQLRAYLKTREKLKIFENIFPGTISAYTHKGVRIEEINAAEDNQLQNFLRINGKNVDSYYTYVHDTIVFDKTKARNDLISIYDDYEILAKHNNSVLKEIVSSINKYLVKNKGAVSDFHLMKDIVERNCDAKEEEINARIPVPLYLGLMGTMLGILIGVGYLVFSGALKDLFSVDSSGGLKGVESLLGGVALAMVASISGILLTTLGSMEIKDAKKKIEQNKNTFLSWIQAELLPNLSNDVSGAFVQMTQNLTKFNKEFSSNTKDLRETLANINQSYQNQANILKAINELKIKNIATANIEIYEKLKNCTDEIGALGDYLENVKTYLTDIHQSIEKTGNYFSKEIEQIEERKGFISKAVGTIDVTLTKALDDLKENSEKQLQKLRESTVIQTKKLEEAVDEQSKALQKKLEETSIIVSELKNLTSIRTSMDNLASSTKHQNYIINDLARAISELAGVDHVRPGSSIPRWAKILFITGFSIISISCLIFLAKELIHALDTFFPL